MKASVVYKFMAAALAAAVGLEILNGQGAEQPNIRFSRPEPRMHDRLHMLGKSFKRVSTTILDIVPVNSISDGRFDYSIGLVRPPRVEGIRKSIPLLDLDKVVKAVFPKIKKAMPPGIQLELDNLVGVHLMRGISDSDKAEGWIVLEFDFNDKRIAYTGDGFDPVLIVPVSETGEVYLSVTRFDGQADKAPK